MGFGEPFRYGLKYESPVFFAMEPEDRGILAEFLMMGQGDHLELGTLFGGSALFSQKVMDKFGRKGQVHSVDSYKVFDDTSADLSRLNAPGAKIVEADTAEYAKGKRFSTCLIDAGHDYANVKRDFEAVDCDIVALHDYDTQHLGVVQVVKESGWVPLFIGYHMAVMRRDIC